MNKHRLIDANEVIEILEFYETDCDGISWAIRNIKELPAAYDINKVVEQLEELIKGCQELYEDSIKLDDLQMRTASRNQAIALKQAIEIVRNGGAE